MRKMMTQRLLRSKTLVWIAINMLFLDIYLSPMREFSVSVEEEVRPFLLPFLLSDIYFLSVFMLSIVYFFSDIPFLERQQMFGIFRMGRVRWNLVNIGYILIMGFLLWLMAFVLSSLLLLPQLVPGTDWGRILGTLSMTNAGAETGQLLEIPYGTLIYYQPIPFLLLSWLLSGLAISLLGMIIYCTSLFCGTICSALVGTIFCILPGMAEYTASSMLNFFSPVSWMRIGIFQSGKIMRMPSVPYMLTGLVVCLLLSIGVSFYKVRRIDLSFGRDEE